MTDRLLEQGPGLLGPAGGTSGEPRPGGASFLAWLRERAGRPSVERAARTGLSLLSPFLALVLHLWLTPHLHQSVWFLFYPAVFFSSWISGFRDGVAASAISVVTVLWFFLPPLASLFVAPGQYAAAGVFFVTGVLFAAFHERLLRADLRSRLPSSRRASSSGRSTSVGCWPP